MSTDSKTPLLQVEQAVRHFNIQPAPGSPGGLLRAVDGVSLVLEAGKTLGIVGESGCGKSTLARMVVGLLEPTAGQIRLHGGDLWERGAAGLARRRQCQMVFQNPAGSMNPRRTVGASVIEPLQARGQRNTQDLMVQMLERVGLPAQFATRMPHQLSGGQQQRASIARALIAQPALVVHDEAIASLDISLQAQILNLLAQMQQELGTAYLFISHDLAAVQTLSHRVMVMYLGQVVETATAEDFTRRPQHPYSIALREATLVPDPKIERARGAPVLRGDVPSPMSPPSGCRFRTRCPSAQAICAEQVPLLRDFAPGHQVACHFVPTTAQTGAQAC